MSLQNLTSVDLRSISKLIEKKESLAGQIAEIDKQLAGYQSGVKTAATKSPAKKAAKASGAKKSKKGGQRGQTRERIMALLGQAGSKGMTVKEIAQQLDSTPNSVGVWFYTTGKKEKQIKKVAPSTYALKG